MVNEKKFVGVEKKDGQDDYSAAAEVLTPEEAKKRTEREKRGTWEMEGRDLSEPDSFEKLLISLEKITPEGIAETRKQAISYKELQEEAASASSNEAWKESINVSSDSFLRALDTLWQLKKTTNKEKLLEQMAKTQLFNLTMADDGSPINGDAEVNQAFHDLYDAVYSISAKKFPKEFQIAIKNIDEYREEIKRRQIEHM